MTSMCVARLPGTEDHRRTCLEPSLGRFRDAKGILLILSRWLPGRSRPADWPPHIYSPRDVAEHEEPCSRHMETKQ